MAPVNQCFRNPLLAWYGLRMPNQKELKITKIEAEAYTAVDGTILAYTNAQIWRHQRACIHTCITHAIRCLRTHHKHTERSIRQRLKADRSSVVFTLMVLSMRNVSSFESWLTSEICGSMIITIRASNRERRIGEQKHESQHVKYEHLSMNARSTT